MTTDPSNHSTRIPVPGDQTYIDPEAAALARRIERREAARLQAAERRKISPTPQGIIALTIVLCGILAGMVVSHVFDPPAPPCTKTGWVTVTPREGEGYDSMIGRTTKHANRESIITLREITVAHNGGSTTVIGDVKVPKSC